MSKKISKEMWQAFTVLKISKLDKDEDAEDVARFFARRDDDENNV